MVVSKRRGPLGEEVYGRATWRRRYIIEEGYVGYARHVSPVVIAMRIHVSCECKEALEERGAYSFEEADDVMIKVVTIKQTIGH